MDLLTAQMRRMNVFAAKVSPSAGMLHGVSCVQDRRHHRRTIAYYNLGSDLQPVCAMV